MEEKELFEDYEVGAWKISPRIYQIFGASVFVHLFVLLTLSQFNLLQAKVCDSTYIGKVCQVLDAASLGSEFLANDPDFVNKPYEPTQIEEITFINLSDREPPLQYPEGYFALANGTDQTSQFPTEINSDFGNFPNSTSSSPNTLDITQPQVLPTPNDSVTSQKLPDSPFSFEDDTKPAPMPKTSRPKVYNPPRNRNTGKNTTKLSNDSPSSLSPSNKDEKTTATNNSNSNSNSNTVAQADANKTANTATPESEEDKKKFNQQPLKDFGAKYGEQILNKSVNIDAPFTITIIAKIDENGKLINPKMQTADGSDPKMSEVAKAAVSAFSDTKLLRPLYDAGGRDVKITFAQNKDNLQAIIETAAKNESDAKKLYNGINIAISLAKTLRKGSDEAVLMEKTQLATQGKTFIINFLIPNEEKNQMIEKSLNNLKKELENKPQPNGLAENKDKSPKA